MSNSERPGLGFGLHESPMLCHMHTSRDRIAIVKSTFYCAVPRNWHISCQLCRILNCRPSFTGQRRAIVLFHTDLFIDCRYLPYCSSDSWTGTFKSRIRGRIKQDQSYNWYNVWWSPHHFHITSIISASNIASDATVQFATHALLQIFFEIVAVFSNNCYKFINVYFIKKITNKIIIHKWCKWLFIRKYLVAMNHETLPECPVFTKFHPTATNFQFFNAVISFIDC